MEVIKIDIERIQDEKVEYVANVLKRGRVVVLPTDTSYGMAVNAINAEAVDNVYRVKNRAKNKPISIIVKNLKQAREYSVVDNRTNKLINRYLPGKLTVIVEKKDNLPENLTGGYSYVGLRIPDCEIIRRLMEKIDFPITATSANISGGKEPYSVKEILKQYQARERKPDLVVDVGILEKNKPSTIVDLSEEKIKLIRSGPINFKDVVNTLKN